YLSEEGLTDIQASLETEQSSLDVVIKEALNTDLRSIGRGILPRDLSKQKTISGPLVLQLLSVLNLSTPAQDQQATPRLFQLTFTDGVKKIKGIEILGEVEGVSLKSPPGIKFLVTKKITFQDNFLYLGPGLLKNLGGEVEEMIREWKVGRQFITRGRKKNDAEKGEGGEGPPPFVPFKIKGNGRQTSNVRDDARSNDDPPQTRSRRDNSNQTDQQNPQRQQNQSSSRGGRRDHGDRGRRQNYGGRGGARHSNDYPQEAPTLNENQRRGGQNRGGGSNRGRRGNHVYPSTNRGH
ncbi:2213_t:CDS:2, partial [Acaulospora colombiana]